MDQVDQGNNSVSLADSPVKRKRGRPRKEHNQSLAVVACAPPGFAKRNVNKPCRVEANQDARDVMVGQTVFGVVDATFDAGYLLTVRIGNSDTTLRGVVFKTGHYVPLSAENDVAPNVQMIRRNEFSHHTDNRIQVHGSKPRSRRKNGQHANSRRNQFSHSLSDSQTADQASHIVTSEGVFAPVVLQPKSINLPSGIPPASPAPHLVSSRSNQVPRLLLQDAPISNGSTLDKQVPHTSHQSRPIDAQKEGITTCEAEAKPGGIIDAQKLLGEVIKKVQSSPQTAETEMENSESFDKSPAKDSSVNMETEVPCANEPLSMKPIQPDHIHPVSVDNSSDNVRKEKLTELLQVVQENVMQDQLSQVQ